MTYPIPQKTLDQNILVLGKTRSGKSSAMRSIVEQMLDDDLPLCILDPKGDWWGLKLAASGKTPGYPQLVIFGGEHADIQINERSGVAIAEVVATGNRPCIIDLGGWMVGERTRFFIDFASTLFKRTRGRRWLVVDEVHNFCPQGKIMDPDAGKMLHWANRLASEGSGKGLTLMAASQRPQKVHKDFVTSMETLIAMKVIHRLDRDAVKDWVDGCGDPVRGKEVMTTIAGLKRGVGWVWSPEIEFGPQLVEFPMFGTYDSFKPQGENVKLTGWPQVDMSELRAKLESVVLEAQANDPKLLKKKIAELEKALGKPREAAMDPRLLERSTKEAYAQGRHDTANRFHELLERLQGKINSCFTLSQDMSVAVVALQDEYSAAQRASVEGVTLKSISHPKIVIPTPRPADKPAHTFGEAIAKREGGRVIEDPPAERKALPIAHRKILDALAWLADKGIHKPDRRLLSAISNYRGGHYKNNLSALRTGGLINGGDGTVSLTSEGAMLAQLKHDDRPIHEQWMDGMSSAEKKIFEVLVNCHPDPLTREVLSERSGYSGGHYKNNLSSLKSKGAIDYPLPGLVALTNWVMPT